MGKDCLGNGMSSSVTAPADLLPLLGERVLLLHGPEAEASKLGLSGSDIDCAVRGLDALWPLRLPPDWRHCQTFHYDLLGWHWILESELGVVVAIDTIDDPDGFGRDALRTDTLFAADSSVVSPAIRAAYLAIKRIRKGDTSPDEWTRIGKLVAEDPIAFLAALPQAVGDELAELLTPSALVGVPPEPSVVRTAQHALWRRRFGSPMRAAPAFVFGLERYLERWCQSSGFVVLIVGPDGSGKSTLSQSLPSLVDGMFKRVKRIHWRPGLLPRPGALVGKEEPDPTIPHAREPYGLVPSAFLLSYYWFDFLIGDWLGILPDRIRSGLIIMERGWWDVAVDPQRYRLSAPPWLVRALGALLRRPDLVVVLEAPPDLLFTRKPELSPKEIERQSLAWRDALPPSIDREYVDVSRTSEAVEAEVREAILRRLEARATARLGPGWITLPSSGESARWWLPRGPRATSRASLDIYQPTTQRARAGWRAAAALASMTAFRLLPRGSAPPRRVRELLAPYVPPEGTYAVARANGAGRYLGLLLDAHGRRRGFAKLSVGASHHLLNEAEAIERLAPLLSYPLFAPRVIAATPNLLLLEAVRWTPRARPWELEEDVAMALGKFFRVGAESRDGVMIGPAHGDVAPWNLLRTATGWCLLDWESASDSARPFHDLCHFFVQAYTLLGRPSESDVLEGFQQRRGSVGRAVEAYALAAGLPDSDAAAALGSYLRESASTVVARTHGERLGLARRRALLTKLGG